ncbi:NAD-dependent epimerase/dehydratase family protein [Halalkalicoccus ordinarius]|uniref:NAD-dependent epimerase/dehydratase family protein n=1 Tax=Halalkalicoccus ordinarius TaxID=3116651 RepID=UPI00300F087C
MSRTAIVTGGLGHAGQWVVDRLARDGWRVICVDLTHPGYQVAEREGITFRAADLTERAEALDLVAEFDPDAVVHFAAYPSPTRHADGRVFETNAMSTYHTLVAAGRSGARVVWASSESTYGFPFAREQTLPDYLPIDEDHPLRPEDPYGTSKVVGEEVGRMVARRYDVPVASIRPSWIQEPGRYHCREGRDLSDGAGNFWSYVDARDVAGMVAAALESPLEGHEAFLAVADENYLDRPTVDAIEEYFGALPEGCSLEGEESAFSTEKAHDLLGWKPKHDWRTAAEESVSVSLIAD